ncbi:hypothetical protein U9M48_016810 [Paspalum notatum var. saurae]|uniref:Reverse transcriptase Ty1/copia-type domain-containing protein n=1 Tax=Paspalum notatum var. saurae TaxID=547442 RepID=A0AAQ3T783_PASNO
MGYGFLTTEGDHCIYTKIIGGNFVLLSLYVDDILIVSNDKATLTEVKAWLSSKFDMKDTGEASYVLGWKYIEIRTDGFLVYAKNHIFELWVVLCMPCYLRNLILSHAIGILSRYQKNPGEKHWIQIKNVLRCVKGTLHYSLCFNGHNLQLQGYTDADWQRIRMTGNLRLCSRKQSSVALSSMEIEYIAASEAAKESVWLREFLALLKVVESASLPVTIFCDNITAIKVSKDPKFYSKSKHIEGRYHYIRDVQHDGIAEFVSQDQLCGPLT